MVAKRSSRALALLLVMPSAAFALGLGDIRLLSPLNAPLDAVVDLDATPEELQSLKAQIAPRDVFVQHGLDWPVFLGSVQVRVERGTDGHAVIRLKSNDAITEPFVTLLLQVDWARGHTVREYTMLLDPPVYTPNQATANAPVAAPSAGAGAHEGEISRPTAAAPPAPAPPSPAPTPAASTTPAPSASSTAPQAGPAGTTHVVKRGETLSQIAGTAAGGGPSSAQTRSWMLAIYQANPRAFDQNMNLMRSGAVLRMPDASAVAAVSATQASAEIRRQYAAWRGAAQGAGTGTGPSATSPGEQGRLRLVSPTEPGGSAAGGTDSAQVKALQGRVHDLEGQLSEQKRLMEVRDAQLADLQRRLAAKQSTQTPASEKTPPPAPAPAATAPIAAAPAPAPAAAPTPAATPTPTPPPVETAPTPPPQPEAAAAPPPTEQPPASVAPSTPPPVKPVKVTKPVAPVASSPGILDSLMDYWWALAAIVVVILAWFGVKTWRSRRQTDFDDSLGRLAAAGAESAGRGFGSSDAATAVRTSPMAAPREEAFLVEESGTHERPRFPGAGAPAASAKHVASDETMSSETAINLDQGDPLAEADFHMAYGLYDQAADLIRIAISREPTRRDLKLKLLEVFFVWGNKDQFLQTARELAETREHAAPGEWEKIVIMGKQLAPEDPLFSSGGGLGGATAGGVDLNLEGGQSRVDFDLLGEPVPGEAASDGVDLDIGSALGGTAAASALGTATDRNSAIDPSFTGSTATTRQMTQKITTDAETVSESMIVDFDPEAPTVEQPAISTPDNPTIRQKVEVAMRQSSAEQTAELAIDDLGLDLGALDTMDQPGLGSSPDAPTLVAGMDDHSRQIMEEAQRRARTEDKPSETGTWHMDESELDAALSDRANGSAHAQEAQDPSATSRLQALNGREVDYDLGDMHGTTQQHATNGSGLDLDIGTATVPDTAFTSTQKLSSDDLALPDLEPVTMSEVGTKLDLARAYMDMGDPDGARNILEEVLTEGSSTQKQEAQRLMESLPG